MRAVFMNTLEKHSGEQSIVQGKVSIGEQEGLWMVLWADTSDEGEINTSVWFEGEAWDEMLAAFRAGIAAKMGEGYIPVIDGIFEESRGGRYGSSMMPILQCYGELHANQDIYEALRAWRRTKAVELKQAAYVIANNRMLWMISAFIPHQLEELLQIPGWGEAKGRKFGAEVLEITNRFARSTTFPLDWVANALDPAALRQWTFKQKEERYRAELAKEQEKRLILQAVYAGQSLDELATAVELPRRELCERIEQLEEEGYDLGPLIERELAELPEEERQRIWNALDAVGDRLLKPIMKEVYGDNAQGESIDKLYDRLRMMRLHYRRQSGNAGNPGIDKEAI